MNVTVINSGFVSGDFLLHPLGYAGERNSRNIYITHPHFKDCYYMLIVSRYGDKYRLRIDDGVVTIPPSLLRSEAELECRFVAMSTPESIIDVETDTFTFMSDSFKLRVDKGIDCSNCSSIPPYEELIEMYKNLADARAAVERAKEDNEAILISIEDALRRSHEEPVTELSEELLSEYGNKFASICENYLSNGFFEDVTAEVVSRIGEFQCGDVCKMTTDQLKSFIQSVMNDMKAEVSEGTANWLSASHHFMSNDGDIIGG